MLQTDSALALTGLKDQNKKQKHGTLGVDMGQEQD